MPAAPSPLALQLLRYSCFFCDIFSSYNAWQVALDAPPAKGCHAQVNIITMAPVLFRIQLKPLLHTK